MDARPDGVYVWRPTRPPGKGWSLVATNNGIHWINRLWYRPAEEEPGGASLQ